MQKMTANQAKQNFGELLDKAQRENITIVKHGRPVAVMISAHKYEQELRHKQYELAERNDSFDGFPDDPVQAEIIAEKIKISREQFARGEGIPAEEVYASLRKKMKTWAAEAKK